MVAMTAVVPRLCAGCGVPLSRYNRQSVCSTCARSARGVDDPDGGKGAAGLAIGAQVTHLRQDAGLSQQQLADRCGLSLALIKMIEQGVRTSAHLTNLAAVAQALRVPISALLEPGSSPGMLVRAARRRRGWSQAILADRAGLSIPYLSLIENDKRPLASLRTVRRLARALGVSPSQLVPWLDTDSDLTGDMCPWCGSQAPNELPQSDT